jgi:transaldolase
MVASKTLNGEGIRTLGTMVFSLPQAIAASQAGCLYISPYYNGQYPGSSIQIAPRILNRYSFRYCFSFSELAAILDESLHNDYEDTTMQNPMSYRIRQMVETYTNLAKKTGEAQPGIVVAA